MSNLKQLVSSYPSSSPSPPSSSSSSNHHNFNQSQQNNYQFSNHVVQQSEPSTINNTNNSTPTLPTTIKIDSNQAIYYYRGESVNRSSIIVSDELVSPLDLTIIIFVLLLWATTILMCINKWGKIRMLEPYQPSFQAADEDDFSSTTTTTTKKVNPVVGSIRAPSTSCKSTLNRSTIRIIPSETDLVNMHDSIFIGMGRSLDIGMGGTIGGYCGCGGGKFKGDYSTIHSCGAGGIGSGGGGSASGSRDGSVTALNNTNGISGGKGDGGGEVINIPRIEISPISWPEERKCKSLEDVRIRLLS